MGMGTFEKAMRFFAKLLYTLVVSSLQLQISLLLNVAWNFWQVVWFYNVQGAVGSGKM